jgi:hypothetical protein
VVVVCGSDVGDPSLNGYIALILVITAAALGVCYFMVGAGPLVSASGRAVAHAVLGVVWCGVVWREQLRRNEKRFDLNGDIPGVPAAKSRAQYHDEHTGGSGGGVAANPQEQLAVSAHDAVAEMAAARAELEAYRARDEAGANANAAGGDAPTVELTEVDINPGPPAAAAVPAAAAAEPAAPAPAPAPAPAAAAAAAAAPAASSAARPGEPEHPPVDSKPSADALVSSEISDASAATATTTTTTSTTAAAPVSQPDLL